MKDTNNKTKILKEMWEENLGFQQAINPQILDLVIEKKIEQTKESLLHIVTEMDELLKATGQWKRVLQEKQLPNPAGIAEEIIDIFKFLVNICLIWDINPETFSKEFWRKSQVNWQKFKQGTMQLEPSDKIAVIDLDGVIAAYPEFFISFLNSKIPDLGLSPYPRNLSEIPGPLDRKTYEELKHAYRILGMKLLIPPIDKADLFTHDLHERGFKILILTRRPVSKYKRIYADTIAWLRNHGIFFDGIFWSEAEKEKDLAIRFPNAKFVIEDDPDQARRIAKTGVKVFLFNRSYNLDVKEEPNLIRVCHFQEIIDKIDAGGGDISHG